MPYSICGLLILTTEEQVCSEHKWPFVRLARGVSLIPLDRGYILLTEGDGTLPADSVQFDSPTWLSEMTSCFSKSAYIEAQFWGGSGMQACLVLEQNRLFLEPVISSGAINYALRYLGIDDGPSPTFFGMAIPTSEDPFALVGLGQHKSVAEWLRDCVQPST